MRLYNADAEVKIVEYSRSTSKGCWEWLAGLTHNGYPRVTVHGKHHRAHRLAYECFRGAIPDGYQIDHLCNNPKCVNPWHLEAVTARENTIRGVSFAAVNARRTHCTRDHEFTPENTLISGNTRTQRYCRKCLAMRTDKRRGKRQEDA